jgi:DNA replication protein DnaC
VQGKAGQIADRLVRCDLVILDELGYLPFSASGGALLFHLLSKLYEGASVVITTNLSFSEMGRGARRYKNDHRLARSADPSLPHRGNRKR